MGEHDTVKSEVTSPAHLTVREAIARLAMMEDMDAELCFSFHNSDPFPITDITDTGDGQVTVSQFPQQQPQSNQQTRNM